MKYEKNIDATAVARLTPAQLQKYKEDLEAWRSEVADLLNRAGERRDALTPLLKGMANVDEAQAHIAQARAAAVAARAALVQSGDGQPSVVDASRDASYHARANADAVRAYRGAVRAAHRKLSRKLLGACGTEVPLLLLPVRLETRFDTPNGSMRPVALKVRVYPDEIHVDAHDPALTADERAWAGCYRTWLAEAGNDAAKQRTAWQALVGRLGPRRAAWVLQATDPQAPPAADRVSSWSRAAVAALMPTRWLVLAYCGSAVVAVTAGKPIRSDLAAGSSPRDGVAADNVRWLSDFDAAVDSGMAVTLALPPGSCLDEGIDRLLVLGIRGASLPAQATAELAALLQSHRFTGGLSLVPRETPTNNTVAAAAGSVADGVADEARTPADRIFDLERGPALLDGGTPMPDETHRRDGHWLAWALGLPHAVFARAEHADGQSATTVAEAVMQAARQADSPLLRRLGLGAGHTVEGVPPAFGQWPALRVGDVPYALLPVMAPNHALMRARSAQSWHVRVAGLAADVRRRRAAACGYVRGADIAGLLAHVGQATTEQGMRFDGEGVEVFEPTAAEAWWRRDPSAGIALDAVTMRPEWWVQAQAARCIATLRQTAPVGLRIGAWGYVEGLRPPAAEDRSTRSRGYLQAPSLSHAATLAVLASGATQQEEGVLAGIDLRSERVHRARWLLEGVRRGQSLATLLGYRFERRLQESGDRRLPSHMARLRTLVAIKGDDRFSEALSAVRSAHIALRAEQSLQQDRDAAAAALASAQKTFDDIETPWSTTLEGYKRRAETAEGVAQLSADAAARARAARTESDKLRPARGASVEEVNGKPRRVRADDDRAEYNDWSRENARLTRERDEAEAAERRDALTSTAAGNELVAARRLHDDAAALTTARDARDAAQRALDALPMADVRAKSDALDRAAGLLRSLVVGAWDDALASSGVNRTVDGLELYRRWRLATQATPERWDVSTVPAGDAELGFPPLGSDEWAALRRQLDMLGEEVDAVADLSVAEGVHQLMRGNPARSAAALDVLSASAATPPPTEHEVVRTPRTGTMFTHRALVVLPASAGTSAWPAAADCPRARVEPALEAWAATLLPSPEHIVCLGSVAAGTDPPQTVRLAASALGLSACAFMQWAAASPAIAEGRAEGELMQLFDERLWSTRPNWPEGAVLRWDPALGAGLRDGDMTLADAVELASSWHALVSAARPMDARDVGGAEAAVDLDEAAARVAALENAAKGAQEQLRLARAALQGQPTANDMVNATDRLRAVLPWRIPAGLPSAASPGTLDDLKRRIDATLVELELRRKKATALPARAQWDELLEVTRALLGGDAQLLPAWRADTAPAAAWWASMRSDSGLVPGDDTARMAAAATWTMQLAYVREGMGRMQRHLDTLLALRRPGSDIAPGQVPWVAGERWVALPRAPGTDWPRGRIGTVTMHPLSALPPDGKPPYKGLLLDDWSETLPTGQYTAAWQAGTTWQPELGEAGAIVETTGVAMHIDQPNSCAPQAALLAAARHVSAWDLDTLQRTVIGAVDLARSRAAPQDGGVERLWFTDELPPGSIQMSWYGFQAGPQWLWGAVGPRPIVGCKTHRTPVHKGYAQHWFRCERSSQRMTVSVGDRMVIYVHLPSVRPKVLVVQWISVGEGDRDDWEHRAVWCSAQDYADAAWWSAQFPWGEAGKVSRHRAGPLPLSGAWIRLEVPAAAIGLEGKVVSGMAFGTADGEAVWGPAGRYQASLSAQYSVDASEDTTWFGSRPPGGATRFADDPGPDWSWSVQPALQAQSNGAPWPSHIGLPRGGMHQHYCTGVPRVLAVQRGDRLFVDVYPSLEAVPSAVIVQWIVRLPDGRNDWEHRAVWCGADLFEDGQWWRLHFPWGARRESSLQRIGVLPVPGEWTRLRVDARDVGLEGQVVSGIAFTLIDGGAAWGSNGVSRPALSATLLMPEED